MNNHLTHWSNRLIEACWLALLVATPLFFNIYSDRVFEADKTAVVRSLALLMLAGWVINWVARQGWQELTRTTWRKQPLLIGLALLAGVYLLTTATAILPSASWVGAYRRTQGAYTFLAYITIAAITLSTMTSAQLRRALTTTIFTSAPVVLYAFIQRIGLDPIPWSGSWNIQVQLRVIGTLGQPIFMAAYLMMVLPLTLSRTIETAQARRWGLTALYGGLIVGQLIAIYWTSSRGPLLALAIGLGVFGMVGLLVWRAAGGLGDRLWRGLWGLGTGGVVLLVGFLVLFNLSPTTTEPYRQTPVLGSVFDTLDVWRTLPTLGRFGQLSETTVGSGRVRVLIWEGVVDLITPHDPIPFADGRTDPLNSWRWLVGYGADSLHLVYGPFYRPEIGSIEVRNPRIDRAHNETLDVVAMTGVLGLLVWQGVFLSAIGVACRQLGLVTTKKQAWLLVGAWVGGGLALATGLTVGRGVFFVGLGFGLGNVLGLGLFLLGRVRAGIAPRPGNPLITLALFSALIAHYVEIQLGIPIVTTRVYFFLFIPLLIVAGRAPEPVPVSTTRRKKTAATVLALARPVLPLAMVLGLVLGMWGYLVMLFPAGFNINDHSPLTAISHMLRRALVTDAPAMMGLLLATWLGGFWLMWGESQGKAALKEPVALLAVLEIALALPVAIAFGWGYGLVLAGIGVAFLYTQWQAAWREVVVPAGTLAILPLAICFGMAATQALLFQQSGVAPAGVDLRLFEAEQAAGFFTTFLALIIGLTLVFSLLLGYQTRRQKTNPTPVYGWGVAVVCLVVAFMGISRTNVRPVRADIIFKQANALSLQAQVAQDPAGLTSAITVYEHVLTLQPDPLYHTTLGLVYLQLATVTPGETDRWQTAYTHLLTAQSANPLFIDYTHNLARFHSTWAQNLQEAERAEQVQLAGREYENALRLSPQNGAMWNEYARVSYVLGNDCAHAQSLYARSIEADVYTPDSYVGLAAVQFRCAEEATLAEMYRAILLNLQEGLNHIALATNPAGFEQLASQYTDLEAFNAALRTYELGRVEKRTAIQGLIDGATTALNENDLPSAENRIQEAINLSQTFLQE